MREILFRGKRIDNKEWIEGAFVKKLDSLIGTPIYFIVGQGTTGGMLDPLCTWYLVDPATIGQYTGLTDKNGRRIFEGDILKEDYRFGGKHILHEVSFGESSFGTQRFVSGKLSDIVIPFDDCENPMCAERETEVIGNIHDTPELLKEV